MKNKFEDPDVLRMILDNIPISLSMKNDELKFVLSNRYHCEYTGKPEEELLGKSDSEVWPGDQAEAFLANDQSVMRSGDESLAEESAVNSEGKRHVFLTRKTKLTTPDGRSFLLCTNTDISALRRRENQYKSLTDHAPLGIAQVNENLQVTFANALFKLYCGGSGSEYEQERVLSKIRERYPDFPAKAVKFETTVQGLGSEPRTMVVISSGWLDIEEEGRSATITLIDITQIAELQRVNEDVSRLNRELAENMSKLKEAQDELVKRGRMEQLGQLTATVAHELRNPLGAVRTSAFLLDRKVRNTVPGLESLIDRINKGVTRCDNIITQLLDFSRNKKLVFKAGKLDDWLVGVVEEEARKLPSVLNIQLDLGLTDIEVPFDPARLQRAVVNLVSNASEAMVGTIDQPLATPVENATITVSTFEADGHISLRVTDNGPGMSPEVLARVREPLYTTKSFGTGLGIPAVEQIAVQHGGRLEIESQVSKGSTFTVWLPKTSAEDDDSVAA